jgi:hypothetical protein
MGTKRRVTCPLDISIRPRPNPRTIVLVHEFSPPCFLVVWHPHVHSHPNLLYHPMAQCQLDVLGDLSASRGLLLSKRVSPLDLIISVLSCSMPASRVK